MPDDVRPLSGVWYKLDGEWFYTAVPTSQPFFAKGYEPYPPRPPVVIEDDPEPEPVSDLHKQDLEVAAVLFRLDSEPAPEAKPAKKKRSRPSKAKKAKPVEVVEALIEAVDPAETRVEMPEEEPPAPTAKPKRKRPSRAKPKLTVVQPDQPETNTLEGEGYE